MKCSKRKENMIEVGLRGSVAHIQEDEDWRDHSFSSMLDTLLLLKFLSSSHHCLLPEHVQSCSPILFSLFSVFLSIRLHHHTILKV